MNPAPFLRPGAAGDVIAWRGSEAISRRQFLNDLAALAAQLPELRANDCR